MWKMNQSVWDLMNWACLLDSTMMQTVHIVVLGNSDAAAEDPMTRMAEAESGHSTVAQAGLAGHVGDTVATHT